MVPASPACCTAAEHFDQTSDDAAAGLQDSKSSTFWVHNTRISHLSLSLRLKLPSWCHAAAAAAAAAAACGQKLDVNLLSVNLALPAAACMMLRCRD